MLLIPSVYTLLMNTIHLSHNTQVAKRTFFRKHTVKLLHEFFSKMENYPIWATKKINLSIPCIKKKNTHCFL